MSKLKLFGLLSAWMLILSANVQAKEGLSSNLLDNTPTHTLTHTLELKPISYLEKGYQMAASTFLPEYEENLRVNGKNDNGFSGSELENNHNSIKNCKSYTLTSCPDKGLCKKCPFANKYILSSCRSGWNKSSNACAPSSCQTISSSYKTTIPNNQICTKITEMGLTCYKDCRSVSCSGYTLNCDTFNVSNSAGKETCPECNNSNANCSPKLCKVSSCMNGYKIADNATTCIALDDTCPANYFKTCETGNQGDPKYTEKATPCYQCKPKDVCPSEYKGLADIKQSIAYDEECKDKRSRVHNFGEISTFLYNSNRNMPSCSGRCKTITVGYSYGDYNEKGEIRYYEPTSAQLSSPETVVKTCNEFEIALSNESIYNIRVLGKITCDKQWYGSSDAEKHIYGQDRNSDIIEFTNIYAQLSSKALYLSNITFKVLKRYHGFLASKTLEKDEYGRRNQILPLAENVSIIGNTGSLRNDIFFKSGENHLYHDTSIGTDGMGSGTMVIGENAKVYFHGIPSMVNFETIFLLGEIIPVNDIGISFSTPATQQLFMQGSNKSYRGLTLKNGTIATYGSWAATWLYVIGNDSSVESSSTSGSNISIAVGNNSHYVVPRPNYGTPNVAMGKNATFNNIKTSNSYSGPYTYMTTKNWENPAAFY